MCRGSARGQPRIGQGSLVVASSLSSLPSADLEYEVLCTSACKGNVALSRQMAAKIATGRRPQLTHPSSAGALPHARGQRLTLALQALQLGVEPNDAPFRAGSGLAVSVATRCIRRLESVWSPFAAASSVALALGSGNVRVGFYSTVLPTCCQAGEDVACGLVNACHAIALLGHSNGTGQSMMLSAHALSVAAACAHR